MSRIARIHARQILDSRGYPTIEVDVVLDSGALGRAAVPVGTSTGRYEVLELRDGGEDWGGRGVHRAIASVHDEIAPQLLGVDADDQEALDDLLVELDGTSALARLGGNAVLGVSLAAAKAAAADAGHPLWRHMVRGAPRLPVPMVNALDGGVHADNRLLVQELMLVPLGATSFSAALRIAGQTYHELGHLLLAAGMGRAVGDEGGYAPQVDSAETAIELLVSAIEKAGFRPGIDIALAVDAAASELVDPAGYRVASAAAPLSSDELVAYWSDLCDQYPIVSLEDPLGEEDWKAWRDLTQRIGRRVQLVGDDLFVTHPSLLQLGIDQGAANAVLVKPNQVGTLTRTLQTINLAAGAGYATVMAHRSGDTEDTTIADLAVATGSRFIKAGALARSERVAKYNRLLRIEEDLGPDATFAGSEPS
jgi:enolase